MPIKNFKNKGLKELFETGKTAKLGKNYHENGLLILDHINAITDLKDCNGVKDFHELKGNRKHIYSMHVTGNYCITFKWNEGTKEVYDIDFEDYH